MGAGPVDIKYNFRSTSPKKSATRYLLNIMSQVAWPYSWTVLQLITRNSRDNFTTQPHDFGTVILGDTYYYKIGALEVSSGFLNKILLCLRSTIFWVKTFYVFWKEAKDEFNIWFIPTLGWLNFSLSFHLDWQRLLTWWSILMGAYFSSNSLFLKGCLCWNAMQPFLHPTIETT